jgi:hypothetical protein
MITAGNPAFIPYLNLSGGVLELIQSFGRKWDKDTFLPPLCSGEWSGTMCLTEAAAVPMWAIFYPRLILLMTRNLQDQRLKSIYHCRGS